MSRNDNRDSVHILKTSSFGYLSHPVIPGFSADGTAPFTVEVWFCLMKDTDGILYGQTDGFTLSVADGLPIFRCEGFGAVVAPKNWKLESNQSVFLTVRFDGHMLTLFMGGLPVAQAEAAASASGNASSGRYMIGKDFTGGIRLIRVLPKALEDQEILSHNAQLPDVSEDCVFQTDFSTRQYRDVSKNALPLGTEGFGAQCTMLTACTQLTGKDTYLCKRQVPINTPHTVLCKFWPEDISDEAVQTLWDMAADRSLLSLELVRQENHAFLLRLMSQGSQVAISAIDAAPQMWHDAAVVLADGKATVYLDGILAGSGSCASCGDAAQAFIGGAFTTQSKAEQGFSGLLAYCAQFSTALSAAETAAYADCPPYLFAPSLVSLASFSLLAPNDLYNGCDLLHCCGSGGFALVDGTTPMDTPEGIPLAIPEDDDPIWSELSEEEQWEMQTLVELAMSTTGLLMGVPAQAVPRLAQRAASRIRNVYSEAMKSVRSLTGPVNRTQALGYVEVPTIIYTPGVAPVLGGTPNMAGGIFSFFSWGAVQSFLANYWKEILAAAALIGVAIAAVTKVIIDAQDKRPQNNGTLSVDSVCWNHNGDPRTGSIHFHQGGDALPASMIYTPANGRIDGTSVLVPTQLGAGAYLEVTMRYTSTQQTPYSGTLNIAENAAAPVLGAFTPTRFTVAPGNTCTVRIPYARGALAQNRCEKYTPVLSLSADGNFLINHHVQLYVLQGVPIAPWEAPLAPFNANTAGYVRTEFLDIFLQNAGSPADFRIHATTVLNASGFEYDVNNGDSFYMEPASGNFKLSKFIRDFATVQTQQHILNCADCATIVSSACAAVGIDLPMGIFVGDPTGGGFDCNRIQSIGYTQWRFPFDTTGTQLSGGFAFHQFNVDITGGGAPGPATPVYDACLKVDGGQEPSQNNNNKVPLLPCALAAEENAVPTVNINEPYGGQFYRERLVLNGEKCGFWQFAFNVPGISFNVNAIRSLSADSGTPRLRLALERMEAFGLPGTEVTAVERRWPPEIGEESVEESVEEADSGFADRVVLWQGERYRVRHCAQGGGYSAGLLMGILMASVTAPMKEDTESGIGERCFVALGRNYLFTRLGQVYYVRPVDPSRSARSLAEEIDRAVMNA